MNTIAVLASIKQQKIDKHAASKRLTSLKKSVVSK